MFHLLSQVQDQSERMGQGIAYIGGSALTALASGVQGIPAASPWVVDLAFLSGCAVVVGRFGLDFLKYLDAKAEAKRKREAQGKGKE